MDLIQTQCRPLDSRARPHARRHPPALAADPQPRPPAACHGVQLGAPTLSSSAIRLNRPWGRRGWRGGLGAGGGRADRNGRTQLGDASAAGAQAGPATKRLRGVCSCLRFTLHYSYIYCTRTFVHLRGTCRLPRALQHLPVGGSYPIIALAGGSDDNTMIKDH